MDGFMGKSLGINSVRAQNIVLGPVIFLRYCVIFYHYILLIV